MTKKTESKTTTPATNPPVAKLRIGLINANIWQRTTDEGNFFSVNFERRYRTTDGEWHSTHSFNHDDLLALAKLANDAHSQISQLRSGGSH